MCDILADRFDSTMSSFLLFKLLELDRLNLLDNAVIDVKELLNYATVLEFKHHLHKICQISHFLYHASWGNDKSFELLALTVLDLLK